jgi:uncharacterized CHY-type Zn-finger protein
MSEYIVCPHCYNPLSQREYVKVVRCRDCKHYMDYEHEYEPNLGYCREHDREEVRDSGFCAWAERLEP